ncbi:MAG TPA: hypothetical protein VFH51_00165 [Myxococcota bacterium]|nr:hypothetical protein [Myxococcota bacterium]
MRRLPEGYRGTHHETLGSDILAVSNALRFPEASLGTDLYRKVCTLEPARWYSIGLLLEVTEALQAKSGSLAMRQMGRMIFDMSHKARVGPASQSARDIVYGIDAMYHHANRGTDIGGWKVLKFEPGLAELWKNTPHPCGLEEGILLQALSVLGIAVTIHQPACFRNGADACHFKLVSTVTDARWTGPAQR